MRVAAITNYSLPIIPNVICTGEAGADSNPECDSVQSKPVIAGDPVHGVKGDVGNPDEPLDKGEMVSPGAGGNSIQVEKGQPELPCVSGQIGAEGEPGDVGAQGMQLYPQFGFVARTYIHNLFLFIIITFTSRNTRPPDCFVFTP